MTSITSTPALALSLARRLNAVGYTAVAVAKSTPEVHVNLTGNMRAVINVVWDDENLRHHYHGRVEHRGRVERLFTRLNHPQLVKLLARY